jgi:hypothetical protein
MAELQLTSIDPNKLERSILWDMRWYVYKCWDADGILRWVGHGKEDRIKYHSSVQPRVQKLFRDSKSRKEIVLFGLTKEEAIEIEADMILTIGREDLCWGPLWNLTNGPGLSGNRLSEKRLAEIRERHSSPEYREAVRQRMMGKQYGLGYKHTEKARQKIGAASKGNLNTLGNLWITNEKLNKQIKPHEKIPEGWRLGITQKQTVKSRMWITNGTLNRSVAPDYAIPEGWRRGFTTTRIY